MRLNFKGFLTENSKMPLPDLMKWVRGFFNDRMSLMTLKTYGDFLEEQGLTAQAELFHNISHWHDPRRRTGVWQGRLIDPFYNIFGHHPFGLTTTEMGPSWFIHPYEPTEAGRAARYWFDDNRPYGTSAQHHVYPGETSYRLSLTNGKWAMHANNADRRANVVSTKHQPVPERFPNGFNITLKDYTPISVEQVPDNVLYYAFYKILEKQIRGGH